MSEPRRTPERAIWLTMAALIAMVSHGCSGATSNKKSANREGQSSAALYADLSAVDVARAHKARQTALETLVRYRSSQWANGRTGSKGETTPIRTYKSVGGAYCREFVEAVETRDSGRRIAVSTACRDRDGQWKLVMK